MSVSTSGLEIRSVWLGFGLGWIGVLGIFWAAGGEIGDGRGTGTCRGEYPEAVSAGLAASTGEKSEASESDQLSAKAKPPSSPSPEKGQSLRISNRPPKPGEMGYRPLDGGQAQLNPPSLLWIHEKQAHTYTVQWAQKKDFSDAVTVADIPWNTYTHHEPWKPGTYYWRYRFKTKEGEFSEWSMVRSVVVPAEATAFPMPTRAEQRRRLPTGHPRLFVRPEELPQLRRLAQGELAPLLKELQAEADRIIRAGPTPEPTKRGSVRDRKDTEAIKHWWPNRVQTERACMEAETLAFVYLLTGDKKYGEAARRWVLHLASWDPDGPTNFALNCEAAKPMLFRPARAYDWAYPMFSPAERQKIQAVMRRRIHDAWVSWEVRQGVGHFTNPYNSHGNRTWHKIGEAGMAFLGEIPEAEDWLDYAVNKFFACYPVWADEDGGWHEGLSYWAGYISKVVGWLQAMEVGLGIDWRKKPFFAQVVDYPMYVAPPGSPNSGFGDLSHRPPSAGWGPTVEFFCRAWAGQPGGSHAPYWQWWAQQWKMRPARGIAAFLYAIRLPPPPPPKAPADWPPSKVFRGIGVASLHTNLLDSRQDVHVLFKSSPFGTQSHGHNPHNSFQLNAYGQELLMTCVYRDLHGSPFHYQWAHSTVAHNCVLVDGQGQTKHTAAPLGRIAYDRLTSQWDHVVGEAAEAYEGRLVRFRRHVVLVKPAAKPAEAQTSAAAIQSRFASAQAVIAPPAAGAGSVQAKSAPEKLDPANSAGTKLTHSPSDATGAGWIPFVVLYDDLEARQPASFQFMLHGLRPFQIDQQKARLLLELDKAGVEVQYLSPVGLGFRQWDGYQPPPTQPFPNQWHVEASTQEKLRTLQMLTVIVPYRTGQRPDWSARRLETDSELGVQIDAGSCRLSIWFAKPGQPDPNHLRLEGLGK